MKSEASLHILLVSFPAQGHITPLLRVAKCLAAKGASVIFITTETAGKTMRTANNIIDKLPTPIGDGSLSFHFFDDGLPDGVPAFRSLDHNAVVEPLGRKFVSEMIKNHADSNKPISCIINNYFFPWVCDVAFEHNIPSVLSWTNSIAVFAVYYNYVHKLIPYPTDADPYSHVEFPFVVLKHNEIPDLIHPSNQHAFLKSIVLQQFKDLSKVFCVLVDSYQELEHDIIDYLSEKSIPTTIRTIGPSFKSLNAKGASNIHGDFAATSDDGDDIVEWLNTKPKGSVVYVAFGTIAIHSREQIHEIAYGLLDSQVLFLWVLKNHEDLPNGFLEETNGRGKVVKWCSQVEVLSHSSVGCFITHCGWNSSIETLSLGVPVVAFPALSDQLTNAKFLVDVYGVGVRLGYGGNNLMTRDEVKKCLLEATKGEKAQVFKQNAIKWQKAADDATADGGSSERNIDAFIQDIKKHQSLN